MHFHRFPDRLGRVGGGNRTGEVNQKWVYISVETPVNTIHTGLKQVRLQRQRFMYNLTSTYSLKSDVPTPYLEGTCLHVMLGPITEQEEIDLNRLARFLLLILFIKFCINLKYFFRICLVFVERVEFRVLHACCRLYSSVE